MTYNKCNIELISGGEILGVHRLNFQPSDGFYYFLEDGCECAINKRLIKRINSYYEAPEVIKSIEPELPEPLIEKLRDQEVTVSYTGGGYEPSN